MFRRARHPTGAELTFDVRRHTYKLAGIERPLKSVSTILGEYFPFDAIGVSEKLGKARGQDPLEIRKEWKMTAVLGSNVHAHVESLLEKKKMVPPMKKQGKEELFYPVAAKAAEAVMKQYEVLGVETLVASKRYAVGGTVDFIARNRKTGAILIGDWKTSQTAASDWSFSDFDTAALPPLSHLPNSKMTKYALQTMLYGHILKTEGYQLNYGKALVEQPLEHGIVQMALSSEKDRVTLGFHLMKPEALLVPDHHGLERSVEDILKDILKGAHVDGARPALPRD
jgi:hypothetical protein